MIRSRDSLTPAYFIPTALEYDNLIRYASAVDRENHLDLVHDSIISTGNLEDAKRFISGRKYSYFSVKEKDLTQDMLTDQVCSKCNQVQPVSEFDRRIKGSLTYLRGECKECRRSYFRKWDRERREKAIKRKKGLFCAQCDEVFTDEYISGIKRPEIKRKRLCEKCRQSNFRKCLKKWQERNPEKIEASRIKNSERNRESVRRWKKKNAKKVNAYNKEYRKRNLSKAREYEKQYRRHRKENKIKT
ncbi:hypothetical protein [Sphingobacterium hotanense]|uniref:Uncharacterized protein n=1 Tax=Sphingobacterium hotanense TaxID=649196 RepID=A0ABT7NLB1_9SPHI|nr:hypothetical protein [Sphingobacterium hotanense]MDM1048039.1 hypothetical protein [Sphingobacterium hotanense]